MLVVACAAQAFRFPFIEPFERHFNESAYQKGVNFAYSGATAATTNALVPGFFLQREVDEYSKFTVKYPGESKGRFTPWPKVKRLSISTSHIARNQ